MDDFATANTRIYTDFSGLKQLQYSKDKDASKKEVAQQFESLFMQLVLHSMRDANKAFSSGLFGNSQMELYQDMFDKQLSLMMSNSNIGLAKIFEQGIEKLSGEKLGGDDMGYIPKSESHYATTKENISGDEKNVSEPAIHFATPKEFVKKLWNSAKIAANMLGTKPEILLAQAALETNWGRNILQENKGDSSKNLFNIKAGSDWDKKTTSIATLEQVNGVLVKEKSNFRNYDSYHESFMDYVNLLKNNERYNQAVDKAANPEQFVTALQKAGYATDEKYAEKILKVYSSQSFNDLIKEAKST